MEERTLQVTTECQLNIPVAVFVEVIVGLRIHTEVVEEPVSWAVTKT